MQKSEFKNKIGQISNIAVKYKWSYVSSDFKTFRLSFKDNYSLYRLDIYLSKMTVCLIPVGGKPVYLKHQDLVMLEDIFEDPLKYEVD